MLTSSRLAQRIKESWEDDGTRMSPNFLTHVRWAMREQDIVNSLDTEVYTSDGPFKVQFVRSEQYVRMSVIDMPDIELGGGVMAHAEYGWLIASSAVPAIDVANKVVYLWGNNRSLRHIMDRAEFLSSERASSFIRIMANAFDAINDEVGNGD